MNARQWFDRFPYGYWAAGYLNGYRREPPALDSRCLEWSEYARGYGEGHADGAADAMFTGLMGGPR